MQKILRYICVIWLILVGGMMPAFAQDTSPQTPNVLVMNFTSILQNTHLAATMLAQIDQEKEQLVRENETIIAQLQEEEARLTELRKVVESDEFAKLAQDFDQKAQQIRQTQDAKEQALITREDSIPRDFLARVRPILQKILQQKQADVILDHRQVWVYSSRVDVTAEVIEQINAVFPSGAN